MARKSIRGRGMDERAVAAEAAGIDAALEAWYPAGVWADTVKSGDPCVEKERADMRRAVQAWFRHSNEPPSASGE